MQKRGKEISFSQLDRLVLSVAFLVTIVALGTMGFVVLENMPLLESLYLTLVTISTLGMRVEETYQFHAGGKIWIMVLIIVGVAGAMIALTNIVSMVVEGHMRSILGKRKVSMKIASLSNHIIVCGYGRMGRSLCENLKSRKTEIVVIDLDSECTAQAERDGFLYILGDAGDEGTLHDAGIERATGLVTTLDSDASNVFATLVARDLNPTITIIARAEREESISRLIRAGANKAICPQVIGATRMANIITRPGVVDFIDFAAQGLDLEAEKFTISEKSPLAGKCLRNANLPSEVGVLVIALQSQDGQIQFNPNPDTILKAGDVMVVTGRAGSTEKLQRMYS